MYICIHIYTWMSTYILGHICHIYTYIHAYTYTSIRIHVCIHIHTWIYTCIHKHMGHGIERHKTLTNAFKHTRTPEFEVLYFVDNNQMALQAFIFPEYCFICYAGDILPRNLDEEKPGRKKYFLTSNNHRSAHSQIT